MALFQITINLDRLATAIETATPVLSRIADALDRAFQPLLPRTAITPSGPDKHHRVTLADLAEKRRQRRAQVEDPLTYPEPPTKR